MGDCMLGQCEVVLSYSVVFRDFNQFLFLFSSISLFTFIK